MCVCVCCIDERGGNRQQKYVRGVSIATTFRAQTRRVIDARAMSFSVGRSRAPAKFAVLVVEHVGVGEFRQNISDGRTEEVRRRHGRRVETTVGRRRARNRVRTRHGHRQTGGPTRRQGELIPFASKRALPPGRPQCRIEWRGAFSYITKLHCVRTFVLHFGDTPENGFSISSFRISFYLPFHSPSPGFAIESAASSSEINGPIILITESE